MKQEHNIKTDICIIGGGSGGLSVAAGAVQMGARVVLIESGKMGGDCLNYGCVPSKALLASAKCAASRKKGADLGIATALAKVDFAAVNAHIHRVIASIAPHDSVERFTNLGVKVIQEHGEFAAPDRVRAGKYTIHSKRFVIATGSSPALPPITGLLDVPFFTNETIFDNKELPKKLIVIGGGPIGLEMAQAHLRLGSKVVVLEAFSAFGRDDSEVAEIVLNSLRAEGLDIREGVKIDHIKKIKTGIKVVFADGKSLSGTHLLVAAGRLANITNLNLEAGHIENDKRSILVDKRLRTSNKKVFAIGDVAGGAQFTHVAAYHAGIVIRNALFRLPAKARTDHIPWVTYVSPEVAQAGMIEKQAREIYGNSIRVLRWKMQDNDRARTERTTTGMVKVVTRKSGKILGASIVGENAGELIQIWSLALSSGLKIGAIAGYIAPYPTLGEINKHVAGSFYKDKLFSSSTKFIVRRLLSLG